MLEIAIRRYRTVAGVEPFTDWLATIRDQQVKARILIRLERLALGNFGDVRAVRAGVCELRIDMGPGYRIYFGRQGSTVVILLGGGDKRSQNADIRRAIESWNEYESRRRGAPGRSH